MSEIVLYEPIVEREEKCDYANDKNEPCWGELTTEEIYTDDSHFWIQYCEGHRNIYRGGVYISQDPVIRLREGYIEIPPERLEMLL